MKYKWVGIILLAISAIALYFVISSSSNIHSQISSMPLAGFKESKIENIEKTAKPDMKDKTVDKIPVGFSN